MLRIPEDLLRLGAFIFQGFPETERSLEHHLKRARTWLAVPVGVDLRGITRELAAWRLTVAMRVVTRSDVRTAIEATVSALLTWDEVGQIQAREQLTVVRDEVIRDMQAQNRETKRSDPTLDDECRALDAAIASTKIGSDSGAAVAV